MPDEIKQISVAGRLTGIVGLDDAIRQAVNALPEGADDSTIAKEILRLIAAKNYIPDKLLPAYRDAVLREFKKYLGQEIEEDNTDALRVVILGPGCYNCTSLEAAVRNVMSEMNLAGDICHITDVKEIAGYGVMGLPALIINRKLVSTGIVPDKKKIQQWLKDALPPNQSRK